MPPARTLGEGKESVIKKEVEHVEHLEHMEQEGEGPQSSQVLGEVLLGSKTLASGCLMAFGFTLAFILPRVGALCQLVPGSGGLFQCGFDGTTVDPDLEVDSAALGEAFRIKFHLKQSSGDFSFLNQTECLTTEVAAMIGFRASFVSLQERTRLQHGRCGFWARGASLLCLKGSTAPMTKTISMSVKVEATHPIPLQLMLNLRPSEPDIDHFSVSYGGPLGRSAFRLLEIPKDDAMDLWRLKVTARQEDEDLPEHSRISTIFLIHESSPCVASTIQNGGCFDPEGVENCVKSVSVSFERREGDAEKVAMHLTFLRQAALTLSKGSQPKLQAGRWVVFVKCGSPVERCPRTRLQVESFTQTHLQWKLASGFLLVVFGCGVVLFLVNAINWFAYAVLYRCSPDTEDTEEGGRHRLWPVMFGRCHFAHLSGIRAKAKMITEPLPFFSTLLSLMLGVFLATTAQFVLTHYGLMVQTGNRDICFYNEMRPGICLSGTVCLPVLRH